MIYRGFTVLAAMLGEALVAQSAESTVQPVKSLIPPFVAEGSIVRTYTGSSTMQQPRSEANVSFYWSNAWWEVVVSYPNTQPGTPKLTSVMRIPDGTRRYTLFADDQRQGAQAASACPSLFPPPGMTLELASWLSLCPKPELPIADGQRMRRFVNVPDCRLSLLNHPQNEGNFTLKYLEPQKAFLSELTIWNNGVSIEIGGAIDPRTGGLMDDVRPYSPPFDKGFRELEYQILQTTNVHGLEFPLRTILKQFTPKWSAKTNDELNLQYSTQLSVARISFSAAELSRRPAAPPSLYACDVRPPNLPNEALIGYMVTNDQWKPLSDKEISNLGRRHRTFAPGEAPEDREEVP